MESNVHIGARIRSEQPNVSLSDQLSPRSGSADAIIADEDQTLKDLTENVRDQEDVERDISAQATLAFNQQEDKKDEKRIEKAQAAKRKFEDLKAAQQQLRQRATTTTASKLKIDKEIVRLDEELKFVNRDLEAYKHRIEQRRQGGQEGGPSAVGSKLPNETRREFLIRTGKITPFAKVGGPRPEDVQGNLANAVLDAEDEAVDEGLEDAAAGAPRSHQNLRMPGFAEEEASFPSAAAQDEFSLRPRKKRRIVPKADSDEEYSHQDPAASPDSFIAADSSDGVDMTEVRTVKRKTRKAAKLSESQEDLTGVDDGNEASYQDRLERWVERRSRARRRRQAEAGAEPAIDDGTEEWFKPSPDEPDRDLENGLKLPGDIYPSLFDYQKTGVQWLAELHDQGVGGIVGDEMGLGKTIQLISFVAALHYSKRLDKPVIVVAPATVLRQWVNEFHRWWPPLRVSILHSSGSGVMDVRKEDSYDRSLDDTKKRTSSSSIRRLVKRVVDHGHVLVTTYAGLQTYEDVLIPIDWGYAVLDEGHKIRNPDTGVTISCKELRTRNRIILSGTPMQNNLSELWSLFDFIYPMRLGTLMDFRKQFEIPIKQGGYANANNTQIMMAQKCAETLKDAISPYLLQRFKVDVAADLPKKSEKVLFCKLTLPQEDAYKEFLKSNDVSAIMDGRRDRLYGIDILRKICNHPDLAMPNLRKDPKYQWGASRKSGKMQVVKHLVHLWKRAGHKILVFCQTRQMLDILEAFVRRQNDIKYLRMDGQTAIKDRQVLVDHFNNDPEYHVFLLTTKVGGLGVNLTGANRVIIFDPDWNPSTDVQARERAWRLGQKREVTIFRLMTAGTIEEKIYHRQIYKQFLSNKVLKDAKQRASFVPADLQDLFTLGSYENGETETSEMFRSSKVAKKTVGDRKFITPGADAVPIVLAGTQKSEHTPSKEQGDIKSFVGVAGMEEFADDKEAAVPANEEERIMQGILGQSAVHSALEHDAIINGTQGDPTVRLAKQEAQLYANEAAQYLRRAHQQARALPAGQVTWTGRNGNAGRPGMANRGGGGRGGVQGSSSVLTLNRQRQGLSNTSASSRSATPDRTLKARDFEKMIPDFIKSHGGQVASKLLVDHFNPYCADQRQAGEFKTALDKVAKLEKRGSSMRGIWGLKDKTK